ncbi:uncharacterized protein [Temnothorax longispinosus]|uniref:uncharacterized protein n=1 Tax=Temnothorax longispinosus TaxID=300112 RepID=UPI003A9A010F
MKLRNYRSFDSARWAPSAKRKPIMATYYHMCSTEENPQHEYCPPGDESLCKWRVAEATGKLDKFEHRPAFYKNVQHHLLPIYKDLSGDDLLERCLGGYTQNCNESFNACIWRLVPKHLHSKTIEIAAYLATAIFNEGYFPILKIMEIMGIVIGQQSKTFAESHNEKRLFSTHRHSLEITKEARTARRMEKTVLQDFFEEEEGLMYGAGIASQNKRSSRFFSDWTCDWNGAKITEDKLSKFRKFRNKMPN